MTVRLVVVVPVIGEFCVGTMNDGRPRLRWDDSRADSQGCSISFYLLSIWYCCCSSLFCWYMVGGQATRAGGKSAAQEMLVHAGLVETAVGARAAAAAAAACAQGGRQAMA